MYACIYISIHIRTYIYIYVYTLTNMHTQRIDKYKNQNERKIFPIKLWTGSTRGQGINFPTLYVFRILVPRLAQSYSIVIPSRLGNYTNFCFNYFLSKIRKVCVWQIVHTGTYIRTYGHI